MHYLHWEAGYAEAVLTCIRQNCAHLAIMTVSLLLAVP